MLQKSVINTLLTHYSLLYCFREKEMATHSSILTLKIPWTEEPGRLQSIGLQRVGHDWVNSLLQSLTGGSDGMEYAGNAGGLGSTPGLGRSPGEGNGNPLQYSCLGNPTDRAAWWATVHRVAKSQARRSDLTFTQLTVFHWLLFLQQLFTAYAWLPGVLPCLGGRCIFS